MDIKDTPIREILEKMIVDIRKQVEENVPETGLFPTVSSKILNTRKDILGVKRPRSKRKNRIKLHALVVFP